MLKTAEWVSPKHPDKLCDRIADAIMIECLKQDPHSRTAIEVMGGHGIVTVTGEVTTNAYVNIREVVKAITGEKLGIQINVVQQSPEIGRGVDDGGAGDQGIMVGYACSENPYMIPQELYLARRLGEYLWKEMSQHDGKTQITLNDEGEVVAIVVSWAKTEKILIAKFVDAWFKHNDLKGTPTVHINPCGDWYLSGFDADTGLTGRKIAVDSYGPNVPIGGGAFAGKDPTKVDRSGAYMARAMAVHLLKSTEAKEVIVKLAYAIGVAEPVQAVAYAVIPARTMDSNNGWKDDLRFDEIDLTQYKSILEPKAIIEILNLRDPAMYHGASSFGHFDDRTGSWNGTINPFLAMS